MPFFIILLVIISILIICNIRIVPEAQAEVIERLGAYHDTFNTGLHVKMPVIDKPASRKRISLKEQQADFDPQAVITSDNVSIKVDTVIFFRIVDPKAYVYGVENPLLAIENLTATTLRNIIGEMTLDQTLTSRDNINSKMCQLLDKATDPWGIKVNRVELKNILPPKDIQDTMEKQMRAEREKRQMVLLAEGEKQAAILKAEGEKESAVIRAEANKIQLVKEAEGHAESLRLHKEAEANGIRTLREADADGFRALKEAGLSNQDIVALRSFDALVDTSAKGNNTKIIIPSDIQNMSAKVASLKEIIKEDN